jgi:hypothetical protein
LSGVGHSSDVDIRDDTKAVTFDIKGKHNVDVILEHQLYPKGALARPEWVKIQQSSRTFRDAAHAEGLRALQQDVDSRKNDYRQAAIFIVSQDLSQRFP